MKKGYRKILIFEIILFFILFLNSFIENILNRFVMIFFLFGIIIFFKFFFGIEKEKKRYVKDIIIELLILYLFSFMLYYIFGIVIGFYRIDNYLTLYGLKEILLPLIIFIVLKEYLRYIILVKSEGCKILYYSILIIFVFLDLTTVISYLTLNTKEGIFDFLALYLLPAISNNIVANYIASKNSYRVNIFWLLVAELYIYVLPIIPNTGDYILSIIKVIFPFIILNRVKLFLDKAKDEEILREYNKKQCLPILVASIIIVVIVYFTSGHFKYYSVAIASGSMVPNFNIGDIVVIEKIDNNYNYLEVGDVVAYKYDGVMVVHRLVNIIEDRGKFYFYTKGDANKEKDNYVIEEEMIVGIVNIKIPYLGLPTVWLSNL